LEADCRHGEKGQSHGLGLQYLSDDLQSGVTFHEAQVALAKVYIGSDDVPGGKNEVVNIEKPHDQSTSVDQIGKKDTVDKAVHLPKTIDEVRSESLAFKPLAELCDRRRASSSGLKMRL
jgi:hypothetical protein